MNRSYWLMFYTLGKSEKLIHELVSSLELTAPFDGAATTEAESVMIDSAGTADYALLLDDRRKLVWLKKMPDA